MDTRLHLGLLPQPWFGDLATATVFILMLNPGFSPCTYFGDYRVSKLREALVGNLRHESGRSYPLVYLDPEFSWHSGGRYFRARLHWLAAAMSKQRLTPYSEALAFVARHVCILQLVPYSSVSFNLSERILKKLESPSLVKAFVHELVQSRPEALIVVTRKSEKWDLPNRDNIVKYVGSETRAAHLGPKSRGGKRIAAHFELQLS